MKEIIINISPEGGASVDAIGFAGRGCTQATKDFEDALGVVSTSRKKKEYNHPVRVTNRKRVGASN